MNHHELTGVEAAAASVMEIWLQDGLNEPDWDMVMFRVREAMAARQTMGREKYRMTLSENQAPLRERIRHLWEEMLDGLAYSQWCRNAAEEHEADDAVFDEAIQASVAAGQCITRISEALLYLDRVMRGLGMDPVAEKTEAKDHLADAAPDQFAWSMTKAELLAREAIAKAEGTTHT